MSRLPDIANPLTTAPTMNAAAIPMPPNRTNATHAAAVERSVLPHQDAYHGLQLDLMPMRPVYPHSRHVMPGACRWCLFRFLRMWSGSEYVAVLSEGDSFLFTDVPKLNDDCIPP